MADVSSTDTTSTRETTHVASRSNVIRKTPASLKRVFTDRGRVHSRRPGDRIRGETQAVSAVSEWFKCRIDPADQRERLVEGRSVVQVEHTMICGFVDIAGNELDIREGDLVEIERGLNGQSFYEEYAKFEVVAEVMTPRSLKAELLRVLKLARLHEG